MTTLAFLQNMWFKDPAGAEKTYQRYLEIKGPVEGRVRFIRDFLFFSCLTGKRLRSTFGEDVCDEIIWEEASPHFGGYSSSKFGYDPTHILKTILCHSPSVILAFGQVAQDGVLHVLTDMNSKTPVLYGPHPAARTKGVVEKLQGMATALQSMKGIA